MFLSKNKNQRWYIYFYKPDGKRTSKSTGTTIKKEATKYLVKFQRELQEKENQKFIPIKMKEYFFNFLKYSESFHSSKTQAAYKTTLKYMEKHFGDIYLSELNPQLIEEYLHKRLKDNSIFVARRELANLSCVFNRAIRDGYLLANPCKGIRKYRLPERLPLFYTEEDFEKLINAIDDDDIKDLTIFAVNTGLRQMELITLEWRQINFNERLLTLDNRTHLTKGKRVHTLPINKNAFDILLKRRKRKGKLENIFTYRNEVIKQDNFSKLYKKFILAAKLNPKLNFHSLRHTFASRLVQKGVSIYTVSKLLCHADIKTTQIYSHLRSDDLRTAVKFLEE